MFIADIIKQDKELHCVFDLHFFSRHTNKVTFINHIKQDLQPVSSVVRRSLKQKQVMVALEMQDLYRTFALLSLPSTTVLKVRTVFFNTCFSFLGIEEQIERYTKLHCSYHTAQVDRFLM